LPSPVSASPVASVMAMSTSLSYRDVEWIQP
jgi:hypothetical protein